MSLRLVWVTLVCGLAVGANLSLSAGAGSQAGGQTSSAAQPAAEASQVRFEGEILRGQIYEHDIGHGLEFRLTPATSNEGGGWVIEILPVVQPADETEFSEIATPPYHAYNDRYLAAAFGYSAREAVQITVRKFYFVRSVEDQQRAADVLNTTLYPGTASDAQKVRAAEEAASLSLGRGELRIIHSKVTPGKGGVPDTIGYVKFEVVLDLSHGFTMRQLLAPRPEPSSR